ncbi:MAG: ABC transporter permease [Actinomycetota bacterium]
MTDQSFLSQVVDWFTDPTQWSGSRGIPLRLLEHVITSSVSVIIAAAIALPVAMYIGHRRRFELFVVSVANLGRAVPSFGLIVLFLILFGLWLRWPAPLRPPIVLAMVLLAIPPILTNAYVGIQSVDADTVEAARGTGMTEGQLLRQIELPLAAPLIVAGLRTAAVQVVATATLAAIGPGGGLGRFIFDGFATRDLAEVFGGAVLVALLAILTELAFGRIERALTPRTTSRGPRRPPQVEAEISTELGPAA